MFDIEKEFNSLNEDANLDSLLDELDNTLLEDAGNVEKDEELQEAFNMLDNLLEDTQIEEKGDIDMEFEEACNELDELLGDDILTESATMEKRKARHAKYRAKMEAKIEKCENPKKLEKMSIRCDRNIKAFEAALEGLKGNPEKYADDIEDLKIGIKNEKELKAKINAKLKSLSEDTDLDLQLEEAFNDLESLLEDSVDVDSILEEAYSDEDDDEEDEDDEVFTEASTTYTVKYDKNSKKKRLISQCELLACKEENPTLFAKYKVARKKAKELRLLIKKQFKSKGVAKYKALVKAKKQIPDK